MGSHMVVVRILVRGLLGTVIPKVGLGFSFEKFRRFCRFQLKNVFCQIAPEFVVPIEKLNLRRLSCQLKKPKLHKIFPELLKHFCVKKPSNEFLTANGN